MSPLAEQARLLVRWCDHNILIPVTLCSILGTVSGRLYPSLFPSAAAIPLLVLLISSLLLSSLRRQKAGLFLCLPLFILVGHLNTIQHSKIPLTAGHIANLITEQQRVTLVGTLATMVEQGNEKSSFEIEVRDLLIHNRLPAWHPVHGRVRLSIRSRIGDLQPGMPLMILAKAGPITNFKTPGAFDYKGFMAAGNVYVSGWIKDRQDIIQIRDQGTTGLQQIRYLPEKIRQQLAHFLNRHLDNTVSGLYQALLVGSRAGVAPEVLEQFKATGTMHLLAISGIHMGLLGLMVGALLNRLFRQSQWLLLHAHVPGLALIGTLPILVGYAFIAGMNTPVLRALIMATIVLTAVILRRQQNLIHLVAAAALIVLSINPMALFTVSFQLSFAAVTILAVYFPQLSNADHLETELSGRLRHLSGYLKTAMLVSIAATVGTLPFMLFYFNRFSPIGPVMNLVVEPFLCFWALPWGLAAIPFIFFAPQAAVLLLKIGSLGITAGQFSTGFGAAVPFASLWTITPAAWEIILYGVMILLWQLRPKSVLAGNTAILAGLLLILHFTWGLWFPQQPKISRITYLDVGQGASTFIHMANGSRILLDGGGSRKSSVNAGERIIAPYLWKQRIWRLDTAIITHPHSDHFNGMGSILAHFQPKTLYINGDERSEGNYAEVIKMARQMGTEIIIPQAGQDIVRGRNILLEVLGMNGLPLRQNASVNDKCLVLKYTHGRRSFLFPADISTRSEAVLLLGKPELRADVLQAAHHGSATSNGTPFIAATDPGLIVVSAGKNGQTHYPAPANLDAWQEQKIQTYITRDQGTITCTTNGSRLNCTGFEKEDRNNTAGDSLPL